MREVAIFGSYNGSSIGDTAILLGLLASLQRIGFGGTRIRVIVPRVFDLDLELKAAGLLIDYELIALDQAPKNLFQRVVKKIFRLFSRSPFDLSACPIFNKLFDFQFRSLVLIARSYAICAYLILESGTGCSAYIIYKSC